MNPKNPIRIVTAASLFDGHDATINIIRRMLQDFGAEVIHLGHNRSVADVVKAVLQEGAQGVCLSSYQGGHMEYFKYTRDLLDLMGAPFVKIYGGGGGVIVYEEKKELEKYGIAQIFHPDDGRKLGLEGMIKMIIEGCDFNVSEKYATAVKKTSAASAKLPNPFANDPIPSTELGFAISELENLGEISSGKTLPEKLKQFKSEQKPLVLGLTGTGGAGKSSLIDELTQRFLNLYPDLKIAIVCVDPSKRKTGGSLLGDRIRMNSLSQDRVFMRSLASRGSGREISDSLPKVLDFIKQFKFDLVIAETSGIGQGNMAITEVADFSMYVMTSDFGAQSQLEKIDMIDFADVIAINKGDKRGALDALRDVKKQYRRSRKIFEERNDLPVFLTKASQFNDKGVHQLCCYLTDLFSSKQEKFKLSDSQKKTLLAAEESIILPPDRQGYLAEITNTIRKYKKRTEEVSELASQIGALEKTAQLLQSKEFDAKKSELHKKLDANEVALFGEWKHLSVYKEKEFIFKVRGEEIRQNLWRTSLSGSAIPRVAIPSLNDWGDRFKFLRMENVPGHFPYTAGVFPLKRRDEDPKRMFAGEGTPERTNKRFHFLCQGEKAQRLSTAFDSVTLYGNDPDLRPDIYGKVGESGVSICTLEDMKKLYANFDLTNPTTSVSMTINGPAPMILAFFFNTAIDQQIEKKEKSLKRKLTQTEWNETAEWTMQQVRGTVQADILKEDQGQNTCIFSISFALKMMGDIQEYFVQKKVRNFYSVSISGYHIAEAGANPISQLAFTLSNGFTFVEYYLSRGLKVDDFAQNLSFFFSNGMDPEYAVLGRVARRIWAIAMKEMYKANDRSQKLKYHVQTSGRSLHAQEISFNDIRTTLQAYLALADNCNSLHTNAYDEAITTPTEESVRRAMAIQLILNNEYGPLMNENPQQGSYLTDYLTELVEEAVLEEFKKISERGGVLGAMETQYQRSKIQDESMHYEMLKHTGELPLIGVNTYIDPETVKENYIPAKIEMARASTEEKNHQLDNCNNFKNQHSKESLQALEELRASALKGENLFEALMKASRVCSLFQMTSALYEVGGQYRRNI